MSRVLLFISYIDLAGRPPPTTDPLSLILAFSKQSYRKVERGILRKAESKEKI